MKPDPVRFGQKIQTPTGAGKVVAFIVAPVETILWARDGLAPGERLDPDLWASATWDSRAERWIVPGAPA